MAGFALSLAEQAGQKKAEVDLFVRRVVLEMATRIIVRSPVDTGRFRANWRVYSEVRGPMLPVSIAVGEEATRTGDYKSAVATVDPTGERTIAEIKAALDAGKYARRWVISNNLPYAWALEYGHSKQAPAGMVGLTIAEFGPIATGASAGLAGAGRMGTDL